MSVIDKVLTEYPPLFKIAGEQSKSLACVVGHVRHLHPYQYQMRKVGIPRASEIRQWRDYHSNRHIVSRSQPSSGIHIPPDSGGLILHTWKETPVMGCLGHIERRQPSLNHVFHRYLYYPSR